jgi:hypothetical protein
VSSSYTTKILAVVRFSAVLKYSLLLAKSGFVFVDFFFISTQCNPTVIKFALRLSIECNAGLVLRATGLLPAL